MTIQIHTAQPQDAAAIHRFITELAIYERAEHEVESSAADIEATLFGPGAKAQALLCHVDGRLAGFAVYFFSYSTWLGKNGIYLEDLYVTPQVRGAGAGKALLRRLAQLACENDCGRLEWVVQDWNQPAIDFYQSIGAKPQAEWVRYRLAGDDLRAFALDESAVNA
ncbi:GNAT family N-acetyltransferase [Chromobacterium subtsugae]|uniref:GNAT family N-acetyltransferase n=1 Tax=Chromobacterium subtsugae TaxID=251747 RepID=A0ABS7FJB0_9NEIS|nr:MULTISPECIES: GNAT family N-acetyltransferase [Chromobacterium]KUM02440.1 GCN5 family acetyltransferase [Chromobacterium subtsugae]KZE87297.1 GCN5 family acetyltransferase [Chromobacterium sp. F49]MBW7568343.1 GNAT family N-acetyltransferase [Chromobacterium subtsugae]MBW8289393.1 GNAT family N-acetyltransferase [Chromobacterium subtsugae]OBU88047.1 GCN5 family acetyltransferase [Chromobacterium subtsugae]